MTGMTGMTGAEVVAAIPRGEGVERLIGLVPAFQRAITATCEGKAALVDCWTREERRRPGLS